MVTLKITNDDDASSSILIPFDPKWEALLRNTNISVIFRKRAPTTFPVNTLYVYITSPASRIAGRVAVESLDMVPVHEAVKLASKGGLTREELLKYADAYDKLAVYSVGAFEAAGTPLALTTLKANYAFSPPQSILRLSTSGKSELDAALGFESSKQTTTRRRSR